MSERKQRLLSTVEVIVSFVRTAHLQQVLHAVSPKPHLNFWRVIYGNLLDMAILEWCKLFGSDDHEHQPVHWRNIAHDPETFKMDLFERLGIYESKWHSYWKDMKLYRDLSVAHHDERRKELNKNYPTLGLALESAYYYYEVVDSELRKQGVDRRQYPEDLRAYCKDFATQCHDIATAATEATKSFKGRVR
jgi:hypothetical protein